MSPSAQPFWSLLEAWGCPTAHQATVAPGPSVVPSSSWWPWAGPLGAQVRRRSWRGAQRVAPPPAQEPSVSWEQKPQLLEGPPLLTMSGNQGSEEGQDPNAGRLARP